MDGIKFKFHVEFQQDILKYTLLDKNGYKALEMYDDTYFESIEHSVIAYTIKRYYKRKRKIPGKTLLIQELIKVFEHRNFINQITLDDRTKIIGIVRTLFTGNLQDGDDILENIERFAQFVDLKEEIESVDLLNFEQYETFSRRVQKAIAPRIKALDEKGLFLSMDVLDRQVRRKDLSPVVPTPFSQINNLTNAGGFIRGSIIVILDKAKKFKTGMLINIAVGYFKLRKNVLIVDLDNGEDEVMLRVEQCITGLTKSQVLSGDNDELILSKLTGKKHEIIVKKFPSLVTTANDIETYVDYLYNDFGIVIEELIIDYIGKMGAISGKESLHERIGEAYIDIGNLADKKKIEHVWTAQHVTRSAAKKRMATKYDSTDIAGAIDISRHVQAIYGLNRSPEEEQENLQRMEVVDQRDGVPNGRAVFKIDIAAQRATQLSEDELEIYKREYKAHLQEVDMTQPDDDDNPRPKRAPGFRGNRKDVDDLPKE